MATGYAIYRLPRSNIALTLCEECSMPILRDEMVFVQARGHLPLVLKHYNCDNPDWTEDADGEPS
jgi:hypothetical protein